jgi:cytoskeletal protein CcmA (bactofilin family)
MLGRRKKNNHASSIELAKLSSLIADNVQIVGDVLFSGGLRVDGRIEGNVINEDGSQSLLVLSDKGHIKGRVVSHDAVVNGTIQGDLVVHHFLELQADAKVTGSISYRQLQMACGAGVQGQLVQLPDASQERGSDANKVVDLQPHTSVTSGGR